MGATRAIIAVALLLATVVQTSVAGQLPTEPLTTRAWQRGALPGQAAGGSNGGGAASPPLWPEQELLPDFIKQRANAGAAFSGGGTRSYLATLGYLRALLDLGVLQDLRYVSSVSGGSISSPPALDCGCETRAGLGVM